jgi:hypothetical protein
MGCGCKNKKTNEAVAPVAVETSEVVVSEEKKEDENAGGGIAVSE